MGDAQLIVNINEVTVLNRQLVSATCNYFPKFAPLHKSYYAYTRAIFKKLSAAWLAGWLAWLAMYVRTYVC